MAKLRNSVKGFLTVTLLGTKNGTGKKKIHILFGTDQCFSPYYNESHIKVRNAIREWVDKEITPFCHEWSENKEIPKSVLKRAAEVGFLAAVSGAGTNRNMAHLLPFPLPGGVTSEEFDIFHEFICIDELARSGSGGLIWALEGGLAIVSPATI
jgi:alkylation response protein AidB-like acyl-CoA dehydrogenase